MIEMMKGSASATGISIFLSNATGYQEHKSVAGYSACSLSKSLFNCFLYLMFSLYHYLCGLGKEDDWELSLGPHALWANVLSLSYTSSKQTKQTKKHLKVFVYLIFLEYYGNFSKVSKVFKCSKLWLHKYLEIYTARSKAKR